MIVAGDVVDGLAIALLLVALASVAMRGLETAVWLLVAQSVVLSLVAGTIALSSGAVHMWAAAALTLGVRAIAIPAVLFLVLRTVALKRETRPILSTRIAIIIAIALTLVAFSVTPRLSLSAAFPTERADILERVWRHYSEAPREIPIPSEPAQNRSRSTN